MAERGQPIDSLFNEPAIQAQFERVTKYLNDFGDLMLKIQAQNEKTSQATGFTEINNAIKETQAQLPKLKQAQDLIAKSEAELTKAIIAREKASRSMVQTENEVIKQITLEEKANQSALKTQKDRISYEIALAKQKAQGLSTSAAEAKIAAQAADQYFQLNKTLKEQERAYLNLALAQGEESEAAKAALKTALDTRSVLDRLDQKLGNYGRTVGNYKTAFDGLGFSFTQVARELPSLAVSTSTFLLAISNNLPMVFDEIGKARTEIAALRAEGQETPSLIARIGSGLLSFNVISSILIATLTILGPQIIDFFSSLVSGASDTEKARKQLEEYNKTQIELLNTLKAIDDLNKIDYGNTQRNLEVQLAYSKANGDSNLKQLAIEKQLATERAANAQQAVRDNQNNVQSLDALQSAANAAGIAYTELLLNRNSALDNKGKLLNDEDYQKELDARKKAFDSAKQIADAAKSTLEESGNAVRDFTALVKQESIEESEAEKKTADNLRKFNLENLKARLQDRIDYEQKFADASALGAITQIAEQRKAADDRAQLLKAQAATDVAQLQSDAQFQIKNNQLTDAEKIRLEQETAAQIRNINTQLNIDLVNNQTGSTEKILKIKADEIKRLAELVPALPAQQTTPQASRNDLLISALEAEQKAFAATQAAREAGYAQEREKLEDNYRSGATSYEKYQKRLAQIAIDNQQDVLNDTISSLEQQLAIYKKYGTIGSEAAQRVVAALANARVQLKQLPKNTSASLDSIQKAFERVAGYINSAMSIIGKAVDNSVVRQKNALQKVEDQQELNYQNELDRINNSSLTDEQKQTALIKLEADRTVQKEANARKEREIERKQAVFEKAATLTQLTLETTLAVLRALNDKTVPYPVRVGYAIAAGVLGAAQIAVAAAAPIPAFEKGTDNAPEGWARVSEKGRELVKEPSGKMYFTPNNESLMYLKGGSEVIPHDEVDRYLLSLMMKNIAAKLNDSPENSFDMSETNKYLKQLTKKKPTIIHQNNYPNYDWINRAIKH